MPWGDQYKIGSDYWIATYPKLDSEEDEYEEYDYDYDEVFEDYIVEHLTHKGWVQV